MPTPDDLILAMLAAEPQHGYRLLEAFNDPSRLGHIWYMGRAQIYAVLKRLERDEWIVGSEVKSANAPTRTEYRVTLRGLDRMRAWLNETDLPASLRRVRVDFLSRIYAARLLGDPVEPLAARQAAACAAERGRLADLLMAAPTEISRIALTLQIVQMEAAMIWITQSFGQYPSR